MQASDRERNVNDRSGALALNALLLPAGLEFRFLSATDTATSITSAGVASGVRCGAVDLFFAARTRADAGTGDDHT